MYQIQSVAVYCGSNPGNHTDYAEAARSLAQSLAKQNITLIYGGAKVGLMGIVADEVLAKGGKAIGILPKHLEEIGVAHPKLDELHLVEDMHERKAKMASLADAFIALPGGIGTLEEIIEVWTWSKMGLHNKPCGFLNTRGYYNHLQSFIDHMISEGFLWHQHNHKLLSFEDTPDQLIKFFQNYIPQNKNNETKNG